MSELLTAVPARRLPRILRRALLGAGIAVAAATGSVAFGIGSSAWAAEPASDGLGSLVSDVTDPLVGGSDSLLGSSPIATIVEPVAASTDVVLDSVPVVSPIVDTVLPAEPVQTVLEPVTGAVDGALEHVGGTVESVVDEVGGVVDQAVPPQVAPAAPVVPPVTVESGPAAAGALVDPADSAAAIETSRLYDQPVATPAADEQVAPSRPLDGATVSGHESPSGAPATGAPAQLAATGSTSAGAGGSAPTGPIGDRPGAPRIPQPTQAALSAAGDEALPASATYDTDSSPD